MRLKKVLAALLTPFMMLLNCPVMAAEAGGEQAVKPLTEIMHKPVESAVTGKRITLYTEVSDSSGIDLVRIYFKAQDAADYSFVALKAVEKEEKGLFEKFKSLNSDFDGQGFSGVLPAPAKGIKSFDYLILTKNKANMVVKSQTYKVTVGDNDQEEVATAEPVQVYTELNQAPSQITGFSDSMVIDTVESAGKLGVVAGLYSGLSSSGTGSTFGGTVAASSGEFTTTATVVSVASAVAVIVGGVAAASGGSNGDSGGVSVSASQILGTWNFQYYGSFGGNGGTATFYANGTVTGQQTSGGSVNITPAYPHSPGQSGGTWSISGNTVTVLYDTGVTGQGTISSDSTAMTLNYINDSNHTYYTR